MRYKNNTRQRRKSIQGLRSFKDSLPKNIRETIFKKANIYSKITDNWKKIVGDSLFQTCHPKSFKNLKTLGIKQLNIMVKRGHEIEVEYSRNIIQNKINKFLGYEFVNKIKLIAYKDNKK
tara:strand:- start:2238 stop:2597 length:360 start_codon:yes stop_codon:yes gene_type:complete